MNEVVLIPTYRRPEFLFYCLALIRNFEPKIPIAIFPDRGTYYDKETWENIQIDENMHVHFVPEHKYYGNSYNVMEAYRWAFNAGYDRIFYVEDDCFVHGDFFSWHREMQDELSNIFCSSGWILNRHAPIDPDPLFCPWYYSIGVCFSRRKLELIAKHASPLYYGDMQGYIEKNFGMSRHNNPFGIQHYEQDGLVQRVLNEDRTQTVASGIGRCTHGGFYGYNRGWQSEEFFQWAGKDGRAF